MPDRDAPLTWEPSGQDFLSPGLSEADLVRRVLDPEAFGAWLDGFWPGLATGEPRNLLEPVRRARPHRRPARPPRRAEPVAVVVAVPAGRRAAATTTRGGSCSSGGARPTSRRGCAALAEEGYLSTHWLGTFAVLALEPAG